MLVSKVPESRGIQVMDLLGGRSLQKQSPGSDQPSLSLGLLVIEGLLGQLAFGGLSEGSQQLGVQCPELARVSQLCGKPRLVFTSGVDFQHPRESDA